MEQALQFAEHKTGVAFVLSLCVGAVLIAALALLRPWPPAARKRVIFCAVVGLAMLAAVLVERRWTIQIDPNTEQVRRIVSSFGIAQTSTWPFDSFEALDVNAGKDGEFELGLSGLASGPLILRRFDSVLEAEDSARRISEIGNWSARRKGYQLQKQASFGEREDFKLPDGRTGFSLELAPLVKIVRSSDASSAIR